MLIRRHVKLQGIMQSMSKLVVLTVSSASQSQIMSGITQTNPTIPLRILRECNHGIRVVNNWYSFYRRIMDMFAYNCICFCVIIKSGHFLPSGLQVVDVTWNSIKINIFESGRLAALPRVIKKQVNNKQQMLTCISCKSKSTYSNYIPKKQFNQGSLS